MERRGRCSEGKGHSGSSSYERRGKITLHHRLVTRERTLTVRYGYREGKRKGKGEGKGGGKGGGKWKVRRGDEGSTEREAGRGKLREPHEAKHST